MRISQESLAQSSLARLRSRLRQLDGVQQQLASGKRISRPSDDPGRMASVLSLRSAQRSREQEERSSVDGQAWVGITDTKLQDAVRVLQRVRELAIRASSSIGPQERAGIATEIEAARDELVTIAKATYLGQGVFAGTASSDAVVRTGGVWTYAGDTTQVSRRIGEGEVVAVTQTGDVVFGFADGADVFTLLDTVASEVTAGNPAAVSGSLTGIDAALGRLMDGLARTGAAGNRIERAIERSRSEQISIRTQVSGIEDVDMAEAIMELQLQEVSYQATLNAMARALQPSLADFLR